MSEFSLIDPGERLIWSGKPDPTRYAVRKSFRTFVFGIFFFGFSLFWIRSAYVAGAIASRQIGFPFWVFGIPFTVAGAGMVLSPFWFFWRGVCTTYALTSRRAVADISGLFARRNSVSLDRIPFVDLQALGGTFGHVLFQEAQASKSNRGMIRRDGFIAIADAAQVEQLLRAAIEKSAEGRASGTSR